ncbi:hypothetical protein [Micrococcoides hystricis]|uniref:Small multi-drug export protein n=1 Tax=Micrococcoides hystricis TaxID=1572761 RepID=A0ABV6PD04_9MICC
MLEALQEFTATVPALWQWAAIILVAAIPFVESYFGSVLGVFAGLPLWIAVAAAVIGNIISMLVFVFSADKARQGVLARRGVDPNKYSKKRQRFLKLFNKYGIAGVSLLGQTLLPSQITSAMLVSVTGQRNKVIGWQIVSILLWGTAFGLLATVGVITISG